MISGLDIFEMVYLALTDQLSPEFQVVRWEHPSEYDITGYITIRYNTSKPYIIVFIDDDNASMLRLNCYYPSTSTEFSDSVAIVPESVIYHQIDLSHPKSLTQVFDHIREHFRGIP